MTTLLVTRKEVTVYYLTSHRCTSFASYKGEYHEARVQNIYRQMFAAAVQYSQDIYNTVTGACYMVNTLKLWTDSRTIPCSLGRQGFRPAPYSCQITVALKLIINLSAALEGLCDWQSGAEACSCRGRGIAESTFCLSGRVWK